jgi:mono/diheme cytochrome c family protein
MALCGCERAAQNMYDQPRGKPYRGSPLFADGAMSRPPPPGTQAYSRGIPADATSGKAGTAGIDRDGAAQAAVSLPHPVTPAMLRRGKELYGVYCMPCHSPAGDGDGRIVQRGFPAPPSYHSDRLRQVPDRHIYDVVSNGFGVMAAYGDRIRPSERWAIVAFVRALQLSQHAPLAQLPADIRQRADAGLAASGGGSVLDGHKGESHKGESQKGESQKGESQKVDGKKGEGEHMRQRTVHEH